MCMYVYIHTHTCVCIFVFVCVCALYTYKYFPHSMLLGANMGPTWVLSAPDGSHVGPMNLAIRDMTIPVQFFSHLTSSEHFAFPSSYVASYTFGITSPIIQHFSNEEYYPRYSSHRLFSYMCTLCVVAGIIG